MAIYKFTDANGNRFELKGPEGLSLAQAQKIFDTQSNSGSLVGLKPGESITSASQAAAGLKSAQAAVGQAGSNTLGALGSGISTSTGIIGTQTAALTSSIADKTNAAVAGALNTANSTPTASINTADYVKQSTAIAPIGTMSTAQVTGVLAQAKNLVDQKSDKMTDSKGVGSYGFTVKQLEDAGIVKPGTSRLVDNGASTTEVLKSPTVFTGKDGITSIDKLLASQSAQDKIQQQLMAQGVAGLKTQGVPTKTLPPASLAGLALGAAKSLSSVTALVKGLPLSAAVTSGLNTLIKDGAFAVKLTDLKIPFSAKTEEVPVVAVDTVNRETVAAATTRVIGNDKVPTPEYRPASST